MGPRSRRSHRRNHRFCTSVPESLFEVPAAITVITSSQLESMGVERAEDFIRMVAGVSIVDSAEVGDSQVNIRGINGARDAENSFAFVVDGILMTNPAAFNREFGNLQQIEVLKGPQGAIYGRNAAAGAIVITTRKPGEEQAAKFKVSAAEDSTMFASATFGGPVNDTIGYQVHADFRTTDGYYTNSFLNADVADDFENFSIGGRLYIEPSDSTSWDIKARYAEVDAASITFNAAFALPTFGGLFFEDVNTHDFVFQPNIDPTNDQDALEVSVKLDHELSWGNLTAWLLYSDIDNAFGADGTSGAFGFFNTEATCISSVANLFASGLTLPPPTGLGPTPGQSLFGPYTPTNCDGTQYQVRNQEDLSFEARISNQATDKLFWQAGFYYLTLEREVGVNLGIDTGQGIDERLFAPQTSFNPTEQLVDDQFDTDVMALFGRVDYDFTDTFKGSLALRFDREDRDVTNLVPTAPRSQFVDFVPDGVQVGGAPLNPALDPAVNPAGVIPTQNETFSQLQPKLSFSWLVNEDFTVFGSWGIGFKSGGFNSQGSNATVNTFFNAPLGFTPPLLIEDSFEEETSSAFEIGFRAQATDRLFIEGAAYQVDVDDMQFFEFLTGPFGLLRVVSNIDEVSLSGVEVSANWEATDYLTLGVGYNVTNSEIDVNNARPETVGNDSPYTPDYTGSILADYSQPFGSSGWQFNANLTWNFVGDTWFHTVQDETRRTLFDLFFPGAGTADYSLTQRDSYSVGNLRLGVSNEQWAITAFVSNLADEEYLEEVIPAPEFGGSFIHPGSLRRAGIEVTYEF